jgi:preprotein translocase subunit SecD
VAPPSRTAPKPGRSLLALLAIIVVLAGLMLSLGLSKPKLGLDLAGGTTVTLTAKPDKPGAPIKSSQMDEAVSIIRERVNAFGVSEAQVAKQGSNIIEVQVPGQGQSRVAGQIGRTAKLEMRQVITYAAAGVATPPPTPSPTPSGKASPGVTKSPSASPKASSSASPKGRALAAALLKAASPKPAAAASPKASQSLSPAQLQQLQQQLAQQQQQQQQQQQSSTPDLTGVPANVVAAFNKLTCAGSNVGQGQLLDPNQYVAICDTPQGKPARSTTKFILGPVKVAGQQITGAQAVPPNPTSGQVQWVVNLTFNGKATSAFANFTSSVASLGASNPKNHFAIVLDGNVYSYPSVESAITGGNAQISGSFDQQSASDLANVLNYGALPFNFKESSIESVSPTLGSTQLNAGLLAGAIGLALVVLYCLMYYRGLGFVAISSLIVSGIITYLSVVLLGRFMGFRLSLAGIAGLIVAIGITADSFVIYFERLRDEVREGRSLRTSVERGWARARRTVLVSDTVSFLAALMLWIFAIGDVQGFAFTLGLTTLIDVLVVFLFTKPMITLLARTKFFGQGHRMSGLDPQRLGMKKRTIVRTAPKEA